MSCYEKIIKDGNSKFPENLLIKIVQPTYSEKRAIIL